MAIVSFNYNWISVKDISPKTDEIVLVANRNDDNSFVVQSGYLSTDNRFFSQNSKDLIDNVEYWTVHPKFSKEKVQYENI